MKGYVCSNQILCQLITGKGPTAMQWKWLHIVHWSSGAHCGSWDKKKMSNGNCLKQSLKGWFPEPKLSFRDQHTWLESSTPGWSLASTVPFETVERSPLSWDQPSWLLDWLSFTLHCHRLRKGWNTYQLGSQWYVHQGEKATKNRQLGCVT